MQPEMKPQARSTAASPPSTTNTTEAPPLAPRGDPRKVEEISEIIKRGLESLTRHRYFEACRTNAFEAPQLLAALKQVYCTSIFFERMVTRRLGGFSSRTPYKTLADARKHIIEEAGHPEMFRECLLKNGVSVEELDAIMPSTFTKALYGYFLATLEHEREEVSSVALYQVMETAGHLFFQAMVPVMRHHGQDLAAFMVHAELDTEHGELGLADCAFFDDATMADCRRVLGDIFRLMLLTLDDWVSAK
jgi:hypothetical protein